ncbi:MAG: hypothetical protein M1821_003148 [Bathelium mastoideum]|nr:MAG: hypothetical protein M1821_003148 [Bathelium mastoideum]KAI9688174.1 MAG: hypothetical protein M1822_001680 [Bathelium mastoideum]
MSLRSILLTLLPLASAHFNLNYPPARGFNEDTLSTFPCGGQNTVSSKRTTWPVGGPIQLDMGHTSTNVQVLIAMGNDPGDAFNTILVPTFHENGPQNFCLGSVNLPSGMNVTEGMNATIQVVTNGDEGVSGGLYNCADITLTTTPLSSADFAKNCVNSTGVATQSLQGASETTMANMTTDSDSAPSSSGSAAAPSSSSQKSAGATVRAAEWVLAAAVGAVGLALL